MNGKNIVVGGLASGTFLFILLFGLNAIMNRITAYDIANFNGMRPLDDPVMTLFFAYPFVIAFTAAYLYDILHPALQGSPAHKGTAFGIILLVVVAIPSDFAMYTSLDWPVLFLYRQPCLGRCRFSVDGDTVRTDLEYMKAGNLCGNMI